MNMLDATLEIQTLGRFAVFVDGKPVAAGWPDETLKNLFCSLLSPLDLYFAWDRICRSMPGVPMTKAGRRQLEEVFIRPLNNFLIKELGFTPLITGPDGIQIDQHNLYVDAVEFYNTVLEGFQLFSVASYPESIEKFKRASELYTGTYLPGMSGKIITNTRNELEGLYRTAVMDGVRTNVERILSPRTSSAFRI